jgi:hypothetical protein
MSDWTSGYVAEIGYTYGYYSELNPNRAALAFLNAGYVPPSLGVHCELGFGQGMSVNIHSAAAGSAWFANDFNPSQVAFAQSLADTSGADAHLTDEAFADFCSRTDLPDFDSIGLHGIWSWISDKNRSVIVEFIRRKLKVGGALYISYNTQPGWAAFAPMRHLMTEHASVMGSYGKGVVNRVDGALEFAQNLLDTNPEYLRANPGMVERFKRMKDQNRHYLAHEYFNKDWHPMHFATMNQWLSPAKIDFACSAHFLEHIDALNLKVEQQNFLKDISDLTFKQTVRDFMLNQQFRKDYWIKGARKLSTIEQTEQIKQQQVVLINSRENVALKITASVGEVTLSEAIYLPILDLISDHKVRSIEEIASGVKSKDITFAQVVQALIVLIGAGHLASVQAQERITKAKKTSQKLNLVLLDKSRSSAESSFLASPVTGGGIAVNRFQQLFLLSKHKGNKLPSEWAQSVWSILSGQGQRLVKDGAAIESAEDNLNELTKQAEEFATKRLPILKALEVI